MKIREKINRIRNDGHPKVIDLFAGCGGLSLGFHSSGFRLIGAVEFDQCAAMSYARNFHRDEPRDIFEINAKPRDITRTEPEDLINEYGLKDSLDSQVDVIIGGPPCQAFARVGRAKLREVAEHPEAFLQDSRGNLYLRYLDYVKASRPVALLMENVPDVLNYGGTILLKRSRKCLMNSAMTHVIPCSMQYSTACLRCAKECSWWPSTRNSGHGRGSGTNALD
jgi:DNA (cytosine-5)-methyltransferase 1